MSIQNYEYKIKQFREKCLFRICNLILKENKRYSSIIFMIARYFVHTFEITIIFLGDKMRIVV